MSDDLVARLLRLRRAVGSTGKTLQPTARLVHILIKSWMEIDSCGCPTAELPI